MMSERVVHRAGAVGDGGPQPDNTPERPPPAPDPSPLTASAGADFNAKRDEAVELKGSCTAHASRSQTLTYLWTISDASGDELVTVGRTGFLTNATQAEATCTVMKKKHMTNKFPFNEDACIEFTLTVRDGENHSDKVELTVQGTTWKPPVQLAAEQVGAGTAQPSTLSRRDAPGYALRFASSGSFDSGSSTCSSQSSGRSSSPRDCQ